jgi:CRISPR-associated endonuclease/helicase Cas3
MNILLISQCEKNALSESRRILDQFAERCGDRTWQTVMTQAGLDTLRKLLRKTARRNTAVACHWLRGANGRELLWLVGDASKFNGEGLVPTNRTANDVLRRSSENDWHSLSAIQLLSGMASLLHDIGKASHAFQSRLQAKQPPERNRYRHEWVSLRLFQHFVGKDNDATWLQRLSQPTQADDWLKDLFQDAHAEGLQAPLNTLPSLAQAVGWLILSHHRLPQLPYNNTTPLLTEHLSNPLKWIGHTWNEEQAPADAKADVSYWRFHDLPVLLPAWQARAEKLAIRLLALHAQHPDKTWLEDAYTLHLARLSLMLADHHFSSSTDKLAWPKGDSGYKVYANTAKQDNGQRTLNQPLDVHLLGVEKLAKQISYGLPSYEQALPRLARHKGLQKRSKNPAFRWQDQAADAARALMLPSQQQGAFIINMASTGCGKTLGNARIVYALNPENSGMRATFALGLRTLTLQTGQAFRERLGLDDDELAVRVGGASRALFEHQQKQAEASGSASREALLEENSHVTFEGDFQNHPLLNKTSHDAKVHKLLAAPVLVCTVDHLIPCCESDRGGGHIAPMLRLMSSDVVLDELDDFDLADLPALARLVFWIGLLGRRVLISSATLPPALITGMFNAYAAGRQHYQRNRGERLNAPVKVCCLWVDEHRQQSAECPNESTFATQHEAFAHARARRLAGNEVRRMGQIEKLGFGKDTPKEQLPRLFAEKIRDCALKLHTQHHSTYNDKTVSFGLVRMANVSKIIPVAQQFYALGSPEDIRIHLMVYHAHFPLLLRSAKEQLLDAVLQRHNPDKVFNHPDIQATLNKYPEKNQLFMVLGSPVTEVGRDHDYDWAVVEPSSMRSIIQLAGRIRRHRAGVIKTPNISILNCNYQALEQKDVKKVAYHRPGFEDSQHVL